MKTINTQAEQLRSDILKMVEEYYALFHKPIQNSKKSNYVYAGRVYDQLEMTNLVDSALDFWLTSGRYTSEFEDKFSRYLNVKYACLTNSGSSANLLAFMALTSPLLGDKRVKKGDEVITVAASFPTTVAPIIQYGAVPVFVDVTIPEYNIDVSQLKDALSDKTKAVMIAHTLGNPFDLKAVKEFCDEHNLWLIEDNCDALGSEYLLNGEWVKTGTIGDIGTSSFYPPHHITMGEGGCVYTNNSVIKRIIESFRDWGRDCWCPSGKDNTCKKRFDWQFPNLPDGYDHKYVYSHFGYNLKVTDMQAAIGCAQLEKLEQFSQARKNNWLALRDGLQELSEFLILPEPTENSNPSWFGFLITLKDSVPFKRKQITDLLEGNGVQTRTLFAGNLLKQPCFSDYENTGGQYRVIGDLKNTDKIMKDSFLVGVYPGHNQNDIQDIIHIIKVSIQKFL